MKHYSQVNIDHCSVCLKLLIAFGERKQKMRQRPKSWWMRTCLEEEATYGDKHKTELKLWNEVGFKSF
jgi:hypothetical protein